MSRGHRDRVDEVLGLVGLAGLGHRYPHELSGGQQQRVALARALAIRPALVLLDEPFSSLDAGLRLSLRRDVARILREAGTPAVIVTHDQDEALGLADRIVVLDRGRILAEGSPADLYRSPASPEAARFLGDVNLLPATVAGGVARTALGELEVRMVDAVPDGPATVLVRPEQLTIGPEAAGTGTEVVVESVDYHGHDAVVVLALADGTRLTARVGGTVAIDDGDRMGVVVSGTVVAWSAPPGPAVPRP